MENMSGPDWLLPSDKLVTTRPEDPVKLRRVDHPFDKSTDPGSVPGTLKYIASVYPDAIALKAKDEAGNLKKYTYREYERAIRTCARAFLKLGLERFHGVCILGFNSPEWFISNLAAIYAGGVGAGIYITNNEEACFQVANSCRANIIVVDHEKQLKKILAIKSRLPHLKQIIQYKGNINHEDVLSWQELMELGEKESDDHLNTVLKTLAINQCCTIIYTSGTTGIPKGAMLSHDNLIYNAKCLYRRINIIVGKEVVVSYLPLSHIAAQIVDIYLMLVCAGCSYFADESALKGTLLNHLLEIRPTRFLAVPRVWEKIHEKMMEASSNNSYVKNWIFQWARAQGYQRNLDIINGMKRTSISYNIANAIIFKKIKQALGFDRCLSFVSAAAPISFELKKFFFSIDLPITEAYGLSEVIAHTLGVLDNYKFAAVGEALDSLQTKIINKDDDGNGEICVYGRHVFMGYLDMPKENIESIDEEGWFRTGDIGRLDEKNLLFVTGRIKELIITAGGENVSPNHIEINILKEMPFLSNAILIGDRRKFLSVLLTFKVEVDAATNEPTDMLARPVQEWLESLGCTATTIHQVFEENTFVKVKEAIQEGIDKVNLLAISNAQKIRKFVILKKDLSLGGGELGPTLKTKRNVIMNKYKSIIDEIYS